ncbi:MAG: transglycosylase domain-containing protein [Flavobacterium sp.]|nr:transglycosylase domain-containing protein [Pedobacter sp.]
MQIPSKVLKISAILLTSLLILILIGGFIAYNKRDAFLKSGIERAIAKAKRDYNLNLTVGSAKFAGLRTLNLENISVVPENRDSLLKIEKFKVGIKILPLIFGDIKLAEIKTSNAWIHLTSKDSIRNYDFLFRKKAADTLNASRKIDLAELANNLLNQLLYKVPDDMDLKNLEIKFTEDTSSFRFLIPTATIVNGKVNTIINVNNNESIWHLEGDVNPGARQLKMMLFAEGKKVELPYLKKMYGLKLNFDTLSTEMKRVTRAGDQFKISGSWRVHNLVVNHPRIASNDIILPQGSIDAEMIFGQNYVAIDSSSVIHIKNIKANPFIKYTLGADKIYELSLHTNKLNAQDLFNSFPQGLFESMEGMQVSGKLQYDMNFMLNSRHPDKVIFKSGMKQENFKVISWGKGNFQKINGPFIYTPYEYGQPMRNIRVGPQNPDYIAINQISPFLKNAVLTAEDPSFYSHNGFVEESIRKSIATNFKEKAFKRGGSTISMQLVKNVYLNRQKTLARKIEEILIVWVIENSHLSSKQRMYEVYLNLIEWGRNVYGIGEASRYYFDKHPSQLDLGESIFLASIVPRPKSGLNFFEGDGSLRTGLRGYFRLIGGLMAKRGLAQPDSNVYGFYSVRLKESLRRGTPVIDSLSADSLIEFGEDQSEVADIFEQIFGKGKPDSLNKKENKQTPLPALNGLKTPAEIRRERREQRRLEREKQNDDGL